MNFFKLFFIASVHGFIFGGPKIWGLDKIEKLQGCIRAFFWRLQYF